MTESERRRQIVEAARDIYVHQGPRAVSMRKVAGAVGVSATALYRHFADKEALMLAVCREGFGLFVAYLQRGARASGGPLQRLNRTGEAYLDFALEQTPYYRVMFMGPFPQFERLAEENDAVVFGEAFELLMERVRECLQEGVFREDDPRELAFTIWSQIHGVVALYLEGHAKGVEDHEALRQVWRRTRERTLRGLLA